MTGADLLQRIWLKLDENTLFYPEAEVIVNGINPAMRLIALLKPDLLTQRVAYSVLAEQSIINIRELAPRHFILRRVLVGTITGDAPTKTAYGELESLRYVSMDSINAQDDWFGQRGPLQSYTLHGRFLLILYKRPEADRTITLVFRAIPTAFSVATMGESPAFAAVWHPLIVDVATALLLIKEGATQVEKARSVLTEAFGKELFGPLGQIVGRQQRTSPVHVRTRQEQAVEASNTP